MTAKKLRVLLVEDHFLARLAVRTLVNGEPDMTVVGEAESGHDAVAVFARVRPDVVVMDLRMPGFDGVAATAELRRRDPAARVLVLSHYDRDEEVTRALGAGALGYVKKDVDGAALLDAIRRVAAGERHLPDPLARRLEEDPSPRAGLSKRERDILQAIFRGLSNAEIGRDLGISEGTVRIHVSNVLLKLGVKRRTEAIAAALKKGLLAAD